MTADLVCLTLIASRQFRQELFDYLTTQSDLVSGFTASDVDAGGAREGSRGPSVGADRSGKTGRRAIAGPA